MDTKALFNIGYGLYVLTTRCGNVDNGCIVNTVTQVTSNPLQVAVTVNKNNYTHELIMNSCVFNVSMLTTETPMFVFEHFGFQSGRHVNKFANCEAEHRSVNGVLFIPKYTNAYLACHVNQSIDFGTHTMFIGDVLDAQVLSDRPSLTYDYYQSHIKPKPQTEKPSNGKRRWECKVCGYIYEGDFLPDDIECPLCKHGKEEFVEIVDAGTDNFTSPKQSPTFIHMNQINLTENIFYVGVNDRHTDLFENHMELPNGVSYNSYLIVDDKVALIDPVEANFLEEYLFKVKSVLKDRKVDYLVINHDEPDHSSTVAAVLREYPEVQVVGNAKTFPPLEAFYGPIENKKVVAEGETLSLGTHTLQFFMVPMVHWPESMVTYEQTSKIVFSNDAFGGFGALNGGIFDDQVNLAFYEDDMRRYYANIVGKVAMQALKAIEKLGAMEIQMIAPSHGLVWRSNLAWVVGKYTQWSKQESEEGVVIVYGSMHGNTARMAEIVARGVAEAGIKEVKVYDVAKTEVSFIMSDIWKYKGVIIGACAHYGSMFPNMSLLVHEINEFKPKDKLYATFGGMSWSGGGVKTLAKYAEEGKWNLVAESVEVKGAPIREEDWDKLYDLGKTVAAAVKGL
ncbi:MAG: flavin reductase [Bacteroidales bacterium]|nr:flavin reductase [Bacteroidales bacterium]